MSEITTTTDEDIRGLIDRIQGDALRELSLRMPEIEAVRAMASGNVAESIDWVEDPIPFAEFVNDPWHMSQPPLGPGQRADMEAFLGLDPKLLFATRGFQPEGASNFREAVLLYGKGGGKDWICSMVQCYVVHILLCMHDVQRVVGLAPQESVDILNVAYSAKQASEVYFTKFLHRILQWRWLRDRFPIVHGRKLLNPEKAREDMSPGKYVNIGASLIRFPHHIRAISEHSENESYEGYNILMWVMDEAAAFRSAGRKANAHKVYGTLRTSAMSRFPSLWRGMMISYPRSADDFMMTKYHSAENDPEVFRSKRSTWDANPTKSESDFETDRKRNPVEHAAKYKCEPPPRFGAAFDPVAIDACVNHERPSLVRTKEALIWQEIVEAATGRRRNKQFVGKALVDVLIRDLVQRDLPRVFHVDGGLTNCPAAMVLAHGEPTIVDGQALNRVVVDVVLQWKPLPDRRLQVSLNNIASLIEALSRRMHIVSGTYDQWNSQSSVEALWAAKISVEQHNIDANDYGMLEGLINLGCVDLPGDEYSEWSGLVEELKNLVRYDVGGRVRYDKPKEDAETLIDNFGGPRYTKDIADCLAGVSRLLNSPEIRAAVGGTVAPRSIRGQAARNSGSPITVRTNTGGYLPPKMPSPAFPLEAGFMGRQMNQAGQAANQHAMLSNISGAPRLRAPSIPTTTRPPKPILRRSR